MWLKMFFWVPWSVCDSPENMQTVVDEMAESGLKLRGFVSSPPQDSFQHPAASRVSPFLSDGPMLWLHVCEDISTSPLLYQFPVEPDGVFLLQDMHLNGLFKAPFVFSTLEGDGGLEFHLRYECRFLGCATCAVDT